VKRLAFGHDVVMLQEIHGTADRLRRFRNDFRATHLVRFSLLSGGAGGVAILVKRSILPASHEAVSWEVLEEGRVAVLRIDYDDGYAAFLDVHYQSWLREVATLKRIAAIITDAKRSGNARSLAMLGGDFNFPAQGEAATRICLSGAAEPLIRNRWNNVSRQRKWKGILDQCVELHQEEHSRLGRAKNSDNDSYWIASRLDRIYCSWPPWMFTLANCKVTTVGTVTSIKRFASSDHVGVGAKLSTKRALPPAEQPIPRWIAEHPKFAEMFAELAATAGLELLSASDALDRTKDLLRNAGKRTLKDAMNKSPDTPEQRLQLILQLARAISTQDVRLASRVLDSLPSLRDAVEVSADAQVTVVDHLTLDRISTEIATEALTHEKDLALDRRKPKQPRAGRAAALARLLKLWTPFARKAINVAIVKEDGSIANTPDEQAAALADYWGGVFCEKFTDPDATHAFLSEFGAKFPTETLRLPEVGDIEEFTKRARHSAPGPDGIPYSAWRATGRTGATVLHRTLCEMAAGIPVQSSFNESLGIFPGKGVSDEDTPNSMKRAAGDTRPLTLKNTDNKILAGTTNFQLSWPIAAWADGIQEGFVKGRQALNNICTIDAQSRIYDAIAHSANVSKVSELPILLLFDLAAAFPSIAHAFLFAVMRFYGFPAGLIHFFTELYSGNVCFGTLGGERKRLFSILSGILQGCPASGSLFVLAVDPFYRMVKSRLSGSISKAFADDLGTIIQRLEQLPIAKSCFDLLLLVSGLALKPKKCVMIVLGADYSEELVARVRSFLKFYVPAWAKFRIEKWGEYLGFRVGHEGGTISSWEKPLNKFRTRTEELSAAGIAPSLGARFYATNIAPTLAYVEQLCAPTPKVLKAEQSAFEKTTKAPHNTFANKAAFYLGEAGMVPFKSLELRGLAARYRAARTTCTCWSAEWEALCAARWEYGPLANRVVKDKRHWKDYGRWNSEAFVDVLARAYDFDFPLDDMRKGLQAAATKALAPVLFPSDLATEVAPRLFRFLAPEAVSWDYLVGQLRVTLGFAKKLAPSIGWALLRTWLNGWVTASRVGAQKRPCKFGCNFREGSLKYDRLDHYLDCDILWGSLLEVVLADWHRTWSASRWNLLVIPPPFLEGVDFRHTEKLIALTATLDTYCHISNERLDVGVTSSSAAPLCDVRLVSEESESDTDSSDGNTGDSSSSSSRSSDDHHEGSESEDFLASPRLVAQLRESFRRVARVTPNVRSSYSAPNLVQNSAATATDFPALRAPTCAPRHRPQAL
jgi:hypothetical protein